MKTEIPTPLTDQAERLYHERSAAYTVRDLCRKLERASPNKAEWQLIQDLLKLYHASWDGGKCRRDCECDKCQAVETAGNHDSATFDSLTEKAYAAMSNKLISRKEFTAIGYYVTNPQFKHPSVGVVNPAGH